MRVKVEAYSGYTANERPLRFTLGEHTIEVKAVVDRWYGEAERCFRVSGDDGNTYVLKYLEREDAWELAECTGETAGGSDPTDDVRKTLH
ncbi:MAG: hypothetical protein ACHQ9S_16025 [Candidatus Binatia bacterium]